MTNPKLSDILATGDVLPEGDVLVDDIQTITDAGRHIRGAGRDKTRLVPDPTNPDVVHVFRVGASDLVFSDFAMEGLRNCFAGVDGSEYGMNGSSARPAEAWKAVGLTGPCDGLTIGRVDMRDVERGVVFATGLETLCRDFTFDDILIDGAWHGLWLGNYHLWNARLTGSTIRNIDATPAGIRPVNGKPYIKGLSMAVRFGGEDRVPQDALTRGNWVVDDCRIMDVRDDRASAGGVNPEVHFIDMRGGVGGRILGCDLERIAAPNSASDCEGIYIKMDGFEIGQNRLVDARVDQGEGSITIKGKLKETPDSDQPYSRDGLVHGNWHLQTVAGNIDAPAIKVMSPYTTIRDEIILNHTYAEARRGLVQVPPIQDDRPVDGMHFENIAARGCDADAVVAISENGTPPTYGRIRTDNPSMKLIQSW